MAADRQLVCPTCHRDFTTTANRQKYCDLCRKADKHRHATRQMPVMFAACDIESKRDGDRQKAVTVSYGREDGTSGTWIFGDGPEAVWAGLRWLIDNLTGVHTDADGKVWRQAPIGFHLNHDAAVYGVALDQPGNYLVHKATQRHGEMTPLCDADGCDCDGYHRRDPALITDVITDGGEADLLAYHPTSEIAVAFTPGRRIYLEHRPHGDRFEDRRVLDIHDVGFAFTGGLEAVIDNWAPQLDAAQRAVITAGKASRSSGFDGWGTARIAKYSEAECVALSRCARLLIDMVRAECHVSIKPTALFGAGSIANATLKYYGAPKSEESDLKHEELALMDYFGGMIETPVIGRVQDIVEELDINSAYPDKLRHVPCTRMGCGIWRCRSQAHKGAILGHVEAEWDVTDQVTSTPPFMVRDRHGSVYQPLVGSALVSLAEYRQAVKRFGAGRIRHTKIWYWVPDCQCGNPMPFQFLADLYEQRQIIKAKMKDHTKDSSEWLNLNVRQEAVKLVLNSMYGKMAQQRPTRGVYTNLHIASLITGATRAQLRKETWARESQGGHVVYQHTDSIKSVGGAPEDGGKALGAWGREPDVHDFVIIQPGFAVPVEPGGKGSTRGVRKADVYDMLPEWLDGVDLSQHPATWPPLMVHTNRMVSRRQAIARGKPWTAGTFEPDEMRISLFSNKRDTANAVQLPGHPTAWRLPPKHHVDEPATLYDRTYLQDYWKQFWQEEKDQ